MPFAPVVNSSQALAVTGTSAAFAEPMRIGLNTFCASCPVWLKQAFDDTVTAEADTNGNVYVPANVPITLMCFAGFGKYVAVIAASGTGVASLAKAYRC